MELNSSQGFSLVKLCPIKTASNGDSFFSSWLGFLKEMGAIKKAFYLFAIKEPTTAMGKIPWKAGVKFCRWELQEKYAHIHRHGSGFGGMPQI